SDGVVHALLHEAAVAVLHVVHVMRWRGCLLLLLLRGAGGEGEECKRGNQQHEYCGERKLCFGLGRFHDGTSFARHSFIRGKGMLGCHTAVPMICLRRGRIPRSLGEDSHAETLAGWLHADEWRGG